MIEIKMKYIVLFIIFMVGIFVLGILNLKRSLKEFIDNGDYTTTELLGDTVAFIIIPIAVLILYLMGKFDDYIIVP